MFQHNVFCEPWFESRLQSLCGQDTWTKQDEIIWNQTQRQTAKHNFFIQAYDFISDNNIDGDYHEFGCHRCRTFRMAMLESQRHFLDKTIFYAYDSFCGMPSDNSKDAYDERWDKGSLMTTEDEFLRLIKKSNFSLDNVRTIKGFYQESLPTIDFEHNFKSRKAALVTIDCDLYESSLPIFEILDKIVQEGTILYIDDYFTGYKGNPTKGVSKALKDWMDNSTWKLEGYRDVGWAGKSYVLYQ